VDAREQLTGVERLGQIIVGAELEAHDLVDVVAPCREHDHGHRRQLRRGAQPAAHLEAVGARAA